MVGTPSGAYCGALPLPLPLPAGAALPPLAVAAIAGDSGPLDFVAFAGIFAAILLMAYGASKLVGKRAMARMKSRHMEVVDSLGIGQDAHIYLVKVAGEYFLVAKSAKAVSMLAKLSDSPEGVGAADSPVGAGIATQGAAQAASLPARFRDLLARQLGAAPRVGSVAGGAHGARGEDKA